MSRLARFLIATFVLCPGCSKSDKMTPSEFTVEFAESLRKADPDLTVTIVGELEVKVTSADGLDRTAFLTNAYGMYEQDPAAKEEVIQSFVAAGLETVGGSQDEVDRTRIVPVIKDRPWLEETHQALMSRGAKEILHVSEDFSSDLVILYAEDSMHNIRYLAPADLEKAGISRTELRELACENLKRLLPQVGRHGTDGLYMITAGGTYESSLLLLDSVWSAVQADVRGDIVVAIPTRDVLLVTGSDDPEGIEKLKKAVRETPIDAPYRLSPKLFVHRNGRFDELKEGE